MARSGGLAALSGGSMMTMDARLGVKKYVCEIPGPFCKFWVFESGVRGWLLFCALDSYGCDHGFHIPVKKSDLSRDARRHINNQYRKR